MKLFKLFSYSAILLFFACTNNEQKGNIELSGTFTNCKNDTLYLTYISSNGPQILDSSITDENGNFIFESLHIPGIGFYTLNLDQQQFCPLILDSGQSVKVKGDALNLGYTFVTEGSEDSKIYREISKVGIRFQTMSDSLGSEFKREMERTQLKKDSFEILNRKYEKIYNEFSNSFSQELIVIIKKNPNSLACLAAVGQLDPDNNIQTYEFVDENLSKQYPKFDGIKSFHDQVVKLKTLAIGSVAPEITIPDKDGKNISLSSLRGKVVLIDFWASWCKPCMAEVPNVKKCYDKYKSKGFEVMGVSLDNDKTKWLGAISDNKMNWIHGCDIEPNGNSVTARNYNVSTIPFTLLIDATGKIIAKNLRGESLTAELEKTFSK